MSVVLIHACVRQLAAHPSIAKMPRQRLLSELGHLPASARSGIKIAQFGPDFDIELYHQSVSTLLEPPAQLGAGASNTSASDSVGVQSTPAAPKLGFQISMTSNTAKMVFDAAEYQPPPALAHVIDGRYRGGRGQAEMVQVRLLYAILLITLTSVFGVSCSPFSFGPCVYTDIFTGTVSSWLASSCAR